MIMNKLLKITLVTGLFSISQLAYAVDITDTYTTGDTLNATKMNNIKSAVNSKQNRVTGTCTPPLVIGAINADGTVVCGSGGDITDVTAGAGLVGGGTSGDVTISLPQGQINIAGAEFRFSDDLSGCTGYISKNGMSWTTGTDCIALKGLHFPQGSTINTIACFVTDNNPTNYIAVNLMRTDLSSATYTFVTGTQTSIDSPNIQTLYNSVPADHPVDNINYTYYLEARIFGNASKTGNMIVGCKVRYTP
jgi:hypothetical protein